MGYFLVIISRVAHILGVLAVSQFSSMRKYYGESTSRSYYLVELTLALNFNVVSWRRFCKFNGLNYDKNLQNDVSTSSALPHFSEMTYVTFHLHTCFVLAHSIWC